MRLMFPVFIVTIILCGLVACKKNVAAVQKPTIIGKWQVIKLVATYVHNGIQVGTSSRTNYTENDFYEYFEDGSGLLSANTPSAYGFSKFTYTINGTNLTQFNGGAEKAISETITGLTDSTLSIHYELQAPDPITGVFETEKNDFDFKRSPL